MNNTVTTFTDKSVTAIMVPTKAADKLVTSQNCTQTREAMVYIFEILTFRSRGAKLDPTHSSDIPWVRVLVTENKTRTSYTRSYNGYRRFGSVKEHKLTYQLY
jgi:hypothetical protein